MSVRKARFRRSAALIRLCSLALSSASTVILGLQDLGLWANVAFTMVAVATGVSAIEAFFNWRARWQAMEEAQYRLLGLRDELDFLLARTSPSDLGHAALDPIFTQWQAVWSDINRQWMALRPGEGTISSAPSPSP
ncbi:SLATT domain-containing protein [Streptomyces sp. NPDC021622]|uniref:SLATT domain-containing protein n=1 Tax=Streptomyces sp. NPDC021622 TaxID=3155013 RepID=UPI0033C63B47